MLKDIFVGFAIGIGIFVTVAIGTQRSGERSVCYEVVSVRPADGSVLTFNACVGEFKVLALPNMQRSGPEPKDEHSSERERKRPGVEL